jgi:hypothetical protein
VIEALVLLLLVWAGMLVPSALRSRNASPHVTVGGFERAMESLRNEARTSTTGRAVFVPGDAGRIVSRAVDPGDPKPLRPRADGGMVARRRMWFERALAASLVTVLLAVAFGGWLWAPAVLTVAITVAYAAVLRRLKLQRDEARRVVRDLELHRPARRLGTEVAEPVAAEAGGGGWGASGTVRLRRWDD